MIKAVLRWALPIVALVVIGPLAGWLTGSLQSPTGSPHTTPLLASSLGGGLFAIVACFVLAAVTGAITAAVIGPLYGLFSAGLVLAWAAAKTGQIDFILHDLGDPAPLMRLAAEGAICTLLGLGSAWAVQQAGRRQPATPGAAAHAKHQSPLAPTSLVAIAMAVAVAAIAATIIAREPLKGQCIAAATGAGIAAGAVGHLAAQNASATLFFLATGIVGMLAPILAGVGAGASVAEAAISNSLIKLANVLPMDFAAGAFLGIPIGLSWAASMIDKRVHAHPHSTAASKPAGT